ncbi:hypothetical protein [Lamprocystis purpurea]|jgi:hypothetical protein|uniref:hypothetical protein n=1 Tax=Lamprocystis purpurea TaxID=61598 RepID=UPI0003614137|nr:hypothetical protein [Lamprocystis purpurea]
MIAIEKIVLTLRGVIWLPRSNVGASSDAEAVASRHGPLERPDGIPTLERGNEKKAACNFARCSL